MPDIELKPQVYKDPRPKEFFDEYHERVRSAPTAISTSRKPNVPARRRSSLPQAKAQRCISIAYARARKITIPLCATG